MANKSPAELKSEGAELKIVLAKVKKKQHNCAMLMSKDGIVLEVHLKKSPEVLVKAAKKAGGMAKGVWGTVTMEGQVLIIDPINDKIPGNLTKVAKKFFGERGLKNRLEIKEPDEESASTEGAPPEEEATVSAREEEPAVEADEPARATGDADDDSATEGGHSARESAPDDGGEEADPRVALEEKLEELQPRIDTLFADTASLMIDGLKDTMGVFTRAIDDELFDRADDALNRVTSVLDDYDGLMAEKRPFLDRMASMARDVERISGGSDDEAATAIARYKREFEYAVENNEWYSSGEKLDQIEALIGEHQDAGTEEEPDVDDNSAEAEEPPAADSASDSPSNERGRLVAAFKALTPHIKTTLKSDDKSVVKNVGTLAKGFAKAIKGGDLAKSQKIMDLLEPMVAQASESSEPSEDEAGANAQAKGNRLKQLKSMRASLDSLLKEMQP